MKKHKPNWKKYIRLQQLQQQQEQPRQRQQQKTRQNCKQTKYAPIQANSQVLAYTHTHTHTHTESYARRVSKRAGDGAIHTHTRTHWLHSSHLLTRTLFLSLCLFTTLSRNVSLSRRQSRRLSVGRSFGLSVCRSYVRSVRLSFGSSSSVVLDSQSVNCSFPFSCVPHWPQCNAMAMEHFSCYENANVCGTCLKNLGTVWLKRLNTNPSTDSCANYRRQNTIKVNIYFGA